MSDDTPEKNPERGKRVGKKGTLRSLTAAEYAAETGASLFAWPTAPTKKSPDKSPSEPDHDAGKGSAPSDT